MCGFPPASIPGMPGTRLKCILGSMPALRRSLACAASPPAALACMCPLELLLRQASRHALRKSLGILIFLGSKPYECVLAYACTYFSISCASCSLLFYISTSKHAVLLCLDFSAYYEYQAMPVSTYITACVIYINVNKHFARPDLNCQAFSSHACACLHHVFLNPLNHASVCLVSTCASPVCPVMCMRACGRWWADGCLLAGGCSGSCCCTWARRMRSWSARSTAA